MTFTFALACVLASATARAAPTASLELDAPAGCIEPEDLQRVVERHLGHGAFVTPFPADLRVAATLLPAGAGWDAEVRLFNREGAAAGQRHLHADGASCRDLDEPLSLIIALMVDAETKLRFDPPVRGTARSDDGANAIVASASEATPRQWTVAGGGSLAQGVLPEPAAGATVLVGARSGAWAGKLGVTALRGASIDVASNAGIDLSLVQAGLQLCPGLRADRLRAELCAGAVGGLVYAVPSGLSPPGSSARPHAGATAALTNALRVAGPWELFAELGVLAPFVRDRFAYHTSTSDTHEVFRMSAFSAWITVGAQLVLR